jgi:hypothetical protein
LEVLSVIARIRRDCPDPMRQLMASVCNHFDHQKCAVRGLQFFSQRTVLIAFMILSLSGCVSRRMTFVSNPPGAMVLLEGREIGYSPASVDFTYYGTRQVTMIKDGYETKTDLVTVPAPWYQWPVIEFFADNLWPHRVTDRRVYTFDLQPKQMVSDEELRARARQLRSESQIGQ